MLVTREKQLLLARLIWLSRYCHFSAIFEYLLAVTVSLYVSTSAICGKGIEKKLAVRFGSYSWCPAHRSLRCPRESWGAFRYRFLGRHFPFHLSISLSWYFLGLCREMDTVSLCFQSKRSFSLSCCSCGFSLLYTANLIPTPGGLLASTEARSWRVYVEQLLTLIHGCLLHIRHHMRNDCIGAHVLGQDTRSRDRESVAKNTQVRTEFTSAFARPSVANPQRSGRHVSYILQNFSYFATYIYIVTKLVSVQRTYWLWNFSIVLCVLYPVGAGTWFWKREACEFWPENRTQPFPHPFLLICIGQYTDRLALHRAFYDAILN